MLKIIKIDPGCDPEIKTIDDSLKSLQDEVGGHIESVTLQNGLVIVVNEEGRLRAMDPCGMIFLSPLDGEMLVGPVMICRRGLEDFADVRDDDLCTVRRIWWPAKEDDA